MTVIRLSTLPKILGTINYFQVNRMSHHEMKLKGIRTASVCVDVTRQMEVDKEAKDEWSELLKLAFIQTRQCLSP
jgi:hypothetical protein